MNTSVRFASAVLLVVFPLTMLTEGGNLAHAFPVGSGSTSSGTNASQLGQIAESAGAVQSFQADLFTGRAQTSVPIFVPPGRKNVQPGLGLSYSSSGGNGWIGMGWNLDLGFIQRDVKKGIPKYNSTDTLIFSFQGVNSELVSVAANEYRARDEALFLKFVFDSTNNLWTVTDKSGTKHTFGGTTDSRQTSSRGTFKWALSKVADTVGNSMTMTYVQDQGQLYPSVIDYNGNDTQSFAATHKVEFEIEDRSDKSFAYTTGARVETNKRLKEVRVKVKNGSGTYQLARKYSLGYSASAATTRALLTSVTECGTDGAACLPAVTFSYDAVSNGLNAVADYTGVERAFASGDYDFISSTNSSDESLVNVADLNGDGYQDRVFCDPTPSVEQWKVQYGGASGFQSAASFGPVRKNSYNDPSRCMQYQTGTYKKQIADLADLNGDGLTDRVTADATVWKVQTNNGAGFEEPVTVTGIEGVSSWGDDSKYIRMRTDFRATQTDLIDMNGDGIPDRVMAESGNNNWKVQLGTGTSFATAVNWGPIEHTGYGVPGDYIRYVTDTGLYVNDLIDLNGDGLPDRVMSNNYNTSWKVQWNTGDGFTSTSTTFGTIQENSWATWSDHIRLFTDFGTTAVDVVDMNGDGLTDRLLADTSNTSWQVQFNNGTGFASLSSFGTLHKWASSAHFDYPRYSSSTAPYQMQVDLMDLNGDGMPDRVESISGNTVWKMQTNKNSAVDELKTIENGRGGKTIITYTPSTRFDNTDTSGKQRLPFPVHVVSQVDQQDGMGNTYTTTYSYKGGMFDAVKREFRGFREVTVTDAAGTKTISTFGQGDYNKGRLFNKEVRDSSNNLFSKEVTTWSDTQPWGSAVDVHFVYVSQQDNYIYDGDSSYKRTEQVFTYDAYGNLASTIEYGDFGASGDERKTVNTYVYGMTAPGSGTGTYLVNTLSKTTLYDTDLTTVKAERYFYYDGAASITTAPTQGLLTKEEEWLNTASGCGSPGTCANNPKTTMTYDSYGNVATVTDARSYTTTNTYETTYRLFLTQISNTLGHTRQFTYDPWIAQILTSTDQNSQVTTTQYDALGRVTKVIAPLDSSTEPTQEFVYDYPNPGTCGSTCTTRVTTKVKSSVPGQTFTQLITYSFADGLGREIQRRSPAEDSAKQIVSGIVTFNNRGLVAEQYVPYFENTSTSYVSPVTSTPKASFTYDAMGRRTRIDYPDSTNSQVAFSDFVKTTTDPRGKQLRYTNDAYGRLVLVEEFNAGSTYTTTYEYDVLNNLKKTTDHLNNQTTVTYDSLSRKTGMTDPDMGTWSYAYDANDNLSSQTDAKSQTISFTYDALNRVTLKNLPGSDPDATYTYDDNLVSYSKGRLTKVQDGSGTHEFTYDKQGRVLTDKKTVDSTAYTFTRTYDAMGRVRTLTYPDTEVVTYTYNGFGDVETIQGVKASVTTDYVKDVNYNASGQITFTKYGNNVTSDYTYNAQTLRLSNILTKKPDGASKLQDLSYTFDNNGNVTHISDLVNSMTQDFTYDDLNRLTQAVGSAYGTQSFQYNAIGNMTQKGNLTMSYGVSGSKPHAVTSASWSSGNGPTFCRDQGTSNCVMTYDANGNMITRAGDLLTYDSENRLMQMKSYDGTDGSQAYTLQPGWNVISFPYLPDNKSVSSVLSSLTFGTDYNQVSTWDSASGTWKHWVNDPDYNDFSAFEFGKTYEIYISAGTAKNLTVSGKSAAVNVHHTLVAGDNFASPSVKAAVNVTTVLSGLVQGTDYSDVKRFNAATQTWESWAGGAFTQFEPGKGYNIVGLRAASFDYGKTETTTTFVYDSTGARVKKTANGITTVYFGKDYDITGSTSTKYIFLGDRRISMKDSAGTLLYYHEDHINSSNVLTDAAGNRAALYEYDPYGQTVTHTGSADVKHRFTGQEADDSTHLYYYGARYYDSQLGRFITADPTIQHPADPQDFNRYAYARNNPIRFTDPTGLGWLSHLIGAIVGIVVGFVAGPVAGFAVYAGLERGISNYQQTGSFLSALKVGSITFAVSFAGGALLGPIAGKLGGALGDAVGAKVGSLAGNYAGQLASLAAEGAVQGALQGGFTGAAETALHGGTLKEIGGNAWKGAYTGAMYGAIAGPAIRLVGDGAASLRQQFSGLWEKLGISGILSSGRGAARVGGEALPKDAKIQWREPQNLQEQLALEEAKSGGGLGLRTKLIEGLSDPDFKGMDKMQYYRDDISGNRVIDIHYVRDPKTGATTDFKFNRDK